MRNLLSLLARSHNLLLLPARSIEKTPYYSFSLFSSSFFYDIYLRKRKFGKLFRANLSTFRLKSFSQFLYAWCQTMSVERTWRGEKLITASIDPKFYTSELRENPLLDFKLKTPGSCATRGLKFFFCSISTTNRKYYQFTKSVENVKCKCE